MSRCGGGAPGFWWVEARMLLNILQHTGWPPKQQSDPDVHSPQVEKPVLTFRGCRLNSALVVGMCLASLMWIKRGCPCLSDRGFPAPRAAGSLVESEKAGTLIKAVFFFRKSHSQPRAFLFGQRLSTHLLWSQRWGSLEHTAKVLHTISCPKIPGARLACAGPLAQGVGPS